MRTIASLVMLMGIAAPTLAQQSVDAARLGSWVPRNEGNCDMIYGDGRQLCLADRDHMQQDQKARDEQSSLRRAQEENQRLRSELLRRELLQRTPANVSASTVADLQALPEFVGWHAENRWFGADRARTEYALLYARDLRQEQPELSGRPLLNALSARVREVFAPARR